MRRLSSAPAGPAKKLSESGPQHESPLVCPNPSVRWSIVPDTSCGLPSRTVKVLPFAKSVDEFDGTVSKTKTPSVSRSAPASSSKNVSAAIARLQMAVLLTTAAKMRDGFLKFF